MIGFIILLLLVIGEISFFILRTRKKTQLRQQKALINLCELGIFVILTLPGVLLWSFRYYVLALLLIVRGIMAVITLVKKKEGKPYRLSRSILRLSGSILLLIFACIPSLLFPQVKLLKPSGSYELKTVSYTWTDENRIEAFETDGSARQVTVQFWYPDTTKEETFPLVVFSHGAFGYRMSNYSTYAELVSNGYIVCSIDHTYHAFFTKQTDGKVITVNPEFLQEVNHVNEAGVSEEQIFQTSKHWLKLRTDDMNFVIDTIEQPVGSESTDEVFSLMDLSKIGVMGHSLGGATSVAIGRQRQDVDAVIDIDGTMLGENLDYKDNAYLFYDEPYPLPLLAIDTTEHYEEGLSYGDLYANNVTLANAIDGHEIHFNDAGHLNFTDLALFSPALSSMLGTGKIDRTYCIETMNRVILDYYNHYLKGVPELELSTVY